MRSAAASVGSDPALDPAARVVTQSNPVDHSFCVPHSLGSGEPVDHLCLRSHQRDRTPLADECPSAIAALEALVTRLGPIARIRIEPGLFDCGNLWPGVGTPPACFGAAIFPGLAMHGWASFLGTGKVAAIALQRSSLQRSRVGPPFGPWQARIVTLVVPPAGWVMP
jgi:hypothetical protein